MTNQKQSQNEVRWKQRFKHFCAALDRLQEAEALAHSRPLSDLEQQGLIQGFEYTHELAWKTMKDFLQNRGIESLFGSKDATREAFRLELIQDGEVWMQMIQDRNLTSHAYDQSTADGVAKAVLQEYLPRFIAFRNTMQNLLSKEEMA